MNFNSLYFLIFLTFVFFLYWFAFKNNLKFQIQTTLTVTITDIPFDCPICLNQNESKEKITSNCKHPVCKSCLSNYFDHIRNDSFYKKPCCSLCRSEITSLEFPNLESQTEISNKYLTNI